MLRRAGRPDWRPELRRFLHSVLVAAQWAGWPFAAWPPAWPGSVPAPHPDEPDPRPWMVTAVRRGHDRAGW
jgi:hypothetical protein